MYVVCHHMKKLYRNSLESIDLLTLKSFFIYQVTLSFVTEVPNCELNFT
jgi:hypothetical protein